MERGSFFANQLVVELCLLLDAEGVLLLEDGEVAEGHQWAGVPEVIPESLGVSGLPEPFNRI